MSAVKRIYIRSSRNPGNHSSASENSSTSSSHFAIGVGRRVELSSVFVMGTYLLAIERSLSFLPSREARCCSKASRRELGAWWEDGVGKRVGRWGGNIRATVKHIKWDTLLSLTPLPSTPHFISHTQFSSITHSVTHIKTHRKQQQN